MKGSVVARSWGRRGNEEAEHAVQAVNRFCVVLPGGYVSVYTVQHGGGITPRGAPVHSVGSACRGRVSGPRVGVGGDGDHGPRGTREAVRVCGQRAQGNSEHSTQF